MVSWNPRANEVFLNALEIAGPDERQAYLKSACGGDAGLLQAVQALLRAHAEAGSFLAGSVADGDTAVSKPGSSTESTNHPGLEKAGTLIADRYKLIEQIGEGGMGTVWMAEQQRPVKRFVALKVIKPGLDSNQVLARFEAERQAVARMDHPNIAKVLDAGTTEETSGRPFFVMELVKGIPITRYCDEHHLTPRQRLELFVPVCQAIQHAHQKGIIHRDIKPSNVLVASFDGKPVPKVIDFGVAKATSEPLTERTLVTGFGSIVGTLEYMSPEQAEFNALDIDTRSDIYSLGVLLYELLTGTTPLTRERLKQSALGELLRLIREEEPPTPSTRLSNTRSTQGGVSAQRQMEMAKMVRGELDWIVMKALEKDRDRRYETANSLAQDIERYLKDEPVQAGPPSPVYRLRKFVKRNKGTVIAASVVLATLLAGICGTTLGLVNAGHQATQAGQERDRAKQETLKADRAREVAESATTVADELRKAAVNDRDRVDKLLIRALGAEGEVKLRLAETRQNLFSIQLARVVNLWQSDPMQAALLLNDQQVCPPEKRDFPWHLYNRLCQTEKAVFRSKAGKQTCAAFSPLGLARPIRLAAGCDQGTVHVWDYHSRTRLFHLKGHKGPVQAVAFSPVRDELFSAGEDGQIYCWDLRSGQQSKISYSMTGQIHGLAISKDGQWLAAGSHRQDPKLQPPHEQRLIDGQVVLWNLKTGERKELLSNHPSGVLRVAISPDGKLLAAGTTHEASVRLWNIATGKQLQPLQGNNVSWVQGLAFSNDGTRLAMAGADFRVHLWDISKYQELAIVAERAGPNDDIPGHSHELWAVSFSPNDRLLATASWDGIVRVWDVDSVWGKGAPLTERVILRGCEPFPVLFTPDGLGLIVQRGKDLVQHNLPIRAESETIKLENAIHALAFSPDGKRIVSICKNELLALSWNPEDSSGFQRLGDFSAPPTCVAFSPDSQTAFLGTKETISRWDLAGRGTRLTPITGHTSAVTALAVSAKLQLLASSSQGVIKLWDMSGKQVWHQDIPEVKSIEALAFHPTEKTLAALTDQKNVTVWDFKDGTFKQLKKIPREPPSRVSDTVPPAKMANVLAFTPSGKHLAFNSRNKAWFFDLARGQYQLIAMVPSTLTAFAFTPDENTAAIGMEDRKIQLWDIPSQRLRATLAGHVREISVLAFSPDGKVLASGDHNRTFLAQVRGGTVKLWSGETKKIPRSLK